MKLKNIVTSVSFVVTLIFSAIAAPDAAAQISWSPMTSTTTFTLRSVWGSSNSDVFIAGHYSSSPYNPGIILRYDGDGNNDGYTDAIWETEPTGTINKLNCIFGTAADSILAVGGGGTILRYNGSTWSAMTSGTTSELRGVWAHAANDAFAVGIGGTILRYNGSSWSPLSSGTTDNLYGVWGSAGNDVYAVSVNNDRILHYDGISWSEAYYDPAATSPGLWFIWGSSATDIFAVGEGGTILHYDGISWSAMTSGTTQGFRGVWGTSASDVFVCGTGGTIRHYNGSSWTAMSSGSSLILWGLWGTSGTDVFLPGQGGIILHYGEDSCNDGLDNDGDGDTDCADFDCADDPACSVPVETNCSDDLDNDDDGDTDCLDTDCAGRVCEDGDACTAADTCSGGMCLSGPARNCNDANLCTDDSCDPSSGCVYANNALPCDDGLYCNGEDTCTGGVCTHAGDPCVSPLVCSEALDQCTDSPPFISASWSPMTSPTDFTLRSVWGSSNTNIFAVGYASDHINGIILHYDGDGNDDGTTDDSWETALTGIPKLNAVRGTSESNIYVVGRFGTILRYNGTSWSSMVSGTTIELRGVFAQAENDVFAVALDGIILHYDGDGNNDGTPDEIWEPMTSNTTEDLYGVWGSSGSNVYAVSHDSDRILHYDGVTWSEAYYNPAATTPGLWFIWGNSATDIFASGEGGTILHYDGINWSAMSSGVTSYTILGLWGTSGTDVFASGGNSTMLHYDGDGNNDGTPDLIWERMNTGLAPGSYLWGFWGTSGSDVFNVGNQGTILHYGEDICDDSMDNDNDGIIDCDDFDCDSDPACLVTIETNCSDDLDNDGDGDTDCADSDCDNFVVEPTTCGAGVCNSTGEVICLGGSEVNTCLPRLSTEDPEVTCNDNQDNDCDGFEDCADSDCTIGADCCGTLVIEAEEMDYHANGAVDGNYWLLWANGAMREEVSFPDTGVYRFEVIAKGDLAYDIGPQMGLLIDGVLVDDALFVDTTTPATFVFDAEISAGRHTVAIRFFNDLWIPPDIDRNLYVDKVAITPRYCSTSEYICNDGLDNDSDGLGDCADSDCTIGADCCGTLVIEAEEMDYHANGAVSGDYWLLWANGMMSEEGVYFPDAGLYHFEVIAKGDLAYDIGPQMGLLIDGEEVSRVFVDTTIPETFIFDAEISEGAHTVVIRFYNDVWVPGVIDRNLYVEKVSITLGSCREDCTDLIDNDGDGLIDCEDSDCTLGADCCGTAVIEAEEMDYHANGAVRGDYWLLWANGMMSEEGVYFPDAGLYHFEVIAKGRLALGVGPEMELIIDGETYGTVEVTTALSASYAFDVEVTVGSHTVSIGFYNDYYDPAMGDDRNLSVDKIVISLLSCTTI